MRICRPNSRLVAWPALPPQPAAVERYIGTKVIAGLRPEAIGVENERATSALRTVHVTINVLEPTGLRGEGIRGSNQALNALARTINAELAGTTIVPARPGNAVVRT